MGSDGMVNHHMPRLRGVIFRDHISYLVATQQGISCSWERQSLLLLLLLWQITSISKARRDFCAIKAAVTIPRGWHTWRRSYRIRFISAGSMWPPKPRSSASHFLDFHTPPSSSSKCLEDLGWHFAWRSLVLNPVLYNLGWLLLTYPGMLK